MSRTIEKSDDLLPQTGFAATRRRMTAIVLRHWYVIRSSWPRAAELMYWPMVQMLTWGFLQKYLADKSGLGATAAGLFIGGVLLWDILLRCQLGFSVAFLEEIWSRNLGHLMMSPLRPAELIGALIVVSLFKLVVAMVPVAILANVMFGFNILSLGAAFAGFFSILVMTSWAMALVSTGAVLRWGLGAESIAWLVGFLVLPLSCVYYPVSVLPVWLQPVAWALPPTHVFEGLRAVVLEQRFRSDLLLSGLALNALYLTAGVIAFRMLLDGARRAGSLIHMGE